MRVDRGDAREVQECGDAGAHDDRDEEARQKSMYLQQVVFATCPLRRRMTATVDNAGFQTKGVNL